MIQVAFKVKSENLEMVFSVKLIPAVPHQLACTLFGMLLVYIC